MIRTATDGAAEIAAFRSRNLDVVISDRLEATFGSDPAAHYGLRTFHDMSDALAWKPDAVFVTNPISMHIATARRAVEAGCHVFIEKPLGCEASGVADLLRLARERGVVGMVGYQQRYHPGYVALRGMIAEGVLGRLTMADLHFGEWLPGMHPYEDYRESHAARQDQGGGVILCLSHEIDMAYWLFGKPRRVFAMGGHLSDLEVNVEDSADIMMSCTSGGREFPVHVHLDFLQKPARRYTHVVGEHGSATFDYPSNRLEVRRLGEAPEVVLYDSFQRNDMFVSEVRDFIACAASGATPPIPLSEAADVLEICLAAKSSLKSGKVEELS